MFVGWIRKDSFQKDLEEYEQSKVIDKSLVLNTASDDSSITIGAYDGNKLVSFVTAYGFDSSILINNFYYLDNVDDEVKKRVLSVLLNNIDDEEKTILFLTRISEKTILEELGFTSYGKFKKAVYSGGGAAFNFTNATAKSITNENYFPIMKNIDKKCFKEERSGYITKKMFKTSSLMLSTEFGYQHSYAVNKNLIKISPWIMSGSAFSDGEKILRGVIYHRGLKHIVAFVPAKVKEITDLYESYKFELVDDFDLMFKNKKPNIDLEMIYGL
ncbi:MAG: hypothetical protein OIF32_10320 [Campylobacterales bacterium]|nr:hypothetical protein [Campylobacterales bacterium]